MMRCADLHESDGGIDRDEIKPASECRKAAEQMRLPRGQRWRFPLCGCRHSFLLAANATINRLLTFCLLLLLVLLLAAARTAIATQFWSGMLCDSSRRPSRTSTRC